jgi:acetyl-CoA/propionyl-CoA carboxylase, biotin carboxylase, biotin carboxyl carrier protein
MFKAVLVANRGEIAVRVISTLQRLGVRAIAVHSDADAAAPHVLLADEAARIGPAPAAESYLSIDAVLAAARATGAEAIHPGYGFLSENAAFARACGEAGIAFVGPPPEAMQALGDKVQAKLAAERAGVPVLPGLNRPGLTDEDILDFAADDAVFPLMVKAAAGGGGRGMRVVTERGALAEALQAARREAVAGFGDDTLLVERYVPRSRHVEVQLLADAHGAAIHLGERECSLQRRHQKVVEEAPSPVVTPEVRERMGAAAVALAKEAGYVGAGTCEFLVPYEDPSQFFFLEVNARLQVEHPVTEIVCGGLDLVEHQLRVAAGEPLALRQEDVVLAGHAIEVRLCAEDAAAGFLPATGTVAGLRWPSGTNVRVDAGIRVGSEVTTRYDSLLAKVIAHGADREEAVDHLVRALDDLRLLGVTTNAGFLRRLVDHPQVRAADMDTAAIERGLAPVEPPAEEREAALVAAALVEVLAVGSRPTDDPWDVLTGWRIDGPAPIDVELLAPGTKDPVAVAVTGPAHDATVRLGDRELRVGAEALDAGSVAVTTEGRRRVWRHADVDGRRWVSAGADAFALTVVEPAVQGSDGAAAGALEAPMPGTVLKVQTSDGATVSEGDVLVVIESMKMELALTAPADATVGAVLVAEGDSVKQGQAVVELEVTA